MQLQLLVVIAGEVRNFYQVYIVSFQPACLFPDNIENGSSQSDAATVPQLTKHWSCSEIQGNCDTHFDPTCQNNH